MSVERRPARLFRKRIIPPDFTPLDSDTVVREDERVIVTEWRTLKPRADFAYGRSCYFLAEGYKVSKLFMEDGELLYYYCDIVSYTFDGGYIFTDLLFDVVVGADGLTRVLDVDEGAHALKLGLIAPAEMCFALEALHKLLQIIYGGGFGSLTQYIDYPNDKQKYMGGRDGN